MRLATELYLPKFPSEKQDSYTYRVKTSTLFNAFARTVNNLASKPFSEPIKADGFDPAFDDWFKNIDLSGRNLHVFANEVMEAGLKYGLTHVLVDFQRTAGIQSLADEKAQGVRPYAIHILPTCVLGWKSQMVGGTEQLTQVRILESVNVDDGEFNTKAIPQVRVLEIGKWSTYRKNSKDEWFLDDAGVVMLNATTPLNFIPLVTYYTRRSGFMTANLPLQDLADLNVKHWQSSSDQDSILHTARVPILAIIGADNGGDSQIAVNVGAGSLFNLPLGADAKFVEHSGAAIEAGRTSLQDLEGQMRLLGAELLIASTGDVTATQSAIDTAQQQCQLSSMAQGLEDTLDQVVDIMARWVGLSSDGNIDVFDDFAAASATGQTETILLNAVNSGRISSKTFFDEMRRRGVINPDLTWEDEEAQLSINAPSLNVTEAQASNG